MNKKTNYSNLGLWFISFPFGFGFGAIISPIICYFTEAKEMNIGILSFLISYVLGIFVARLVLQIFTKTKLYKRMID